MYIDTRTLDLKKTARLVAVTAIATVSAPYITSHHASHHITSQQKSTRITPHHITSHYITCTAKEYPHLPAARCCSVKPLFPPPRPESGQKRAVLSARNSHRGVRRVEPVLPTRAAETPKAPPTQGDKKKGRSYLFS